MDDCTQPAIRGCDRRPSLARVGISLALLGAYVVTRLLNLGLLPMVSDEGTYITWGVRALHARAVEDWLASLEDGKQPLLAWLMPPFLAVVPDRLVAGRLVSVLTGLANLVLVAMVGRKLFGGAAGWVGAALYVVAPIALVHDRMALYDSLVTTTSLLVLWGALAWAERPTHLRAGALGLAMGLAMLTKLSALFFLVLVPVAVTLWQRQALARWWRLAQGYFLAAAVYSVLYVSPIIGNIQAGNFQRYSLTAGEVLQVPDRLWWKNAVFIVEAAGVYLGWPLTVLALAGLIYGLFGGGRGSRIAALWTVAPLLMFVVTAKIIYSRYFVFCFVAALLPAAHAIVTLGQLRLSSK
ncbi:MAG: ArnT family glycosyltransferase, partial [Chloroflexota bacterium]